MRRLVDSLHDLDPAWLRRFRDAALAMPGAVEKPHWSRPSFAAPGKGKNRGKPGPIFAVLWEDEGRAVLKFTPEQQEENIAAKPGMYEPVPGAWGERGYTLILLRGKGAAGAAEIKRAVQTAWDNVAKRGSRS
ncbi:MAG: MmcQ/YjbR family DNA-binding protein [Phycisphaeraceae bacterium]|nr:MmcQ/YjbR family DNA-binding protein [Phycisphaeraceae bacterium]